MIYRTYAQKDTTIYEERSRTNQNTGGDQILEVSKIFNPITNNWVGNSRILSKFDISAISQSIVNGSISGSGDTEFYLNLTSVEEVEVNAEYSLEVFPISQSWDGGVGQYNYNPHSNDGASWVYRTGNTKWNITNPSVFNEVSDRGVPLDGIILYEGFGTVSTGSAYLTESINDMAGNPPFAFVQDDKLIISASQFSGTTLVFPAQLEENKTYGLQFQLDPGTFTDVQFRLEDPTGVVKTDGAFGNYESFTMTQPATQSFQLTSTMSGVHKLRYTFFDANETLYPTKTASFDEVYVYEIEGDTVAWETFALNTGGFALKNVIKNTNGVLPTMAVSESKLTLESSNIGGGDATFNKILDSTLEYTVTTLIDNGTFPEIGFALYNPYGIKMRSGITNLTSSFTTPTTQSITFTPLQSGNYTFAYTFFESGSIVGGRTGSIDDFKITSSGSLPTVETSAAGYHQQSGGATWYTSSVDNTNVSQIFNKYTTDLSVNVTSYVNDWISGGRPNDGFIVKRPATAESGSTRYGSSKFFSSETNTIYVPTLDVRWDDSQFNTGSLLPLVSTNIIVYPKNLLAEYKETSKARIRVLGRERFPQRTFSSTSLLTDVKYLPQTTYYQIRDAETNLVIVPFDTKYTKVSCDADGNYFDFWFNTFQPERFYQLEFRVDNGSTKSYYDGNVFKVVR